MAKAQNQQLKTGQNNDLKKTVYQIRFTVFRNYCLSSGIIKTSIKILITSGKYFWFRDKIPNGMGTLHNNVESRTSAMPNC